MSTYYCNINDAWGVNGDGTSASPFNVSQLKTLIEGGTVEGVSINEDTIYVKGTRTLNPAEVLFNNINVSFTIKAWPGYGPWYVGDSDYEWAYFGAGTSEIEVTFCDLYADGFKLSNDLNLKSSTFNFKNCIVGYLDGDANTSVDVNINLYGSSILDGSFGKSYGSNTLNCIVVDTVFENSRFVWNDSSPQNSLEVSSCYFTCASDWVFEYFESGNTATGSATCNFEYNITSAIPSYVNANESTLNYSLFGLPEDSLSRWTENEYDEGFYNSTRTGYGAFYFEDDNSSSSESSESSSESSSIDADGHGHIGAFYFGDVNETIDLDFLSISATLLQPSVSVTNSESVSIIPKVLQVGCELLQPKNVYATQDIEVNFVGVPRAGSSPLEVDFTATVNFSSENKGKYIITEYRWCFDYTDSETDEWVSTTSPNISHTYTGYRGQKYSVKVCVSLDLA